MRLQLLKCSHERKDCLWVSHREQHFGQRRRLLSVRAHREKPSWSSFPTPANGIFLQRCLQSDTGHINLGTSIVVALWANRHIIIFAVEMTGVIEKNIFKSFTAVQRKKGVC